MKRISLAMILPLILIASTAWSQDPGARGRGNLRFSRDETPTSTLGPVTPTPEMWFYEQFRRQYNDPKAVIRAKAEAASANRKARLESQKWYGVSNSRPMANPISGYGTYSPRWVANSRTPNQWSGGNYGWNSYGSSGLGYGLW